MDLLLIVLCVFYPSDYMLLDEWFGDECKCLIVCLFPFATIDANEGGVAEECDPGDYQEEDQGQLADQGKPLLLLMSFALLFYLMQVLPIYANA